LSGQDTKAADELSGQNLSQYIPNRLSPLKPREHQSSRLPSAALSSGARIVNSHVEFAHPKDMTALQVSVSPLLSQNQRLVNNYLFLRVSPRFYIMRICFKFFSFSFYRCFRIYHIQLQRKCFVS